ncbi:hypothetical protein [Actinacidiphila oryziradicis]|uniref:hypothetical protein n=1 Tax=Actinacidiphila oryziradicis TaxID=2571141 RepID=UPI00145D70BF|nr:hypothetical protein [Actinacidiphila oryziradicis]
MTDKPRTPADISDDAFEAIRDLNHATAEGGLEYPGEAYATIDNLKVLAQQLPQALRQIREFLGRLEADGHLRTDNGPDDLAFRMEDLRTSLTTAACSADALYQNLDEAHNALRPITYRATLRRTWD